MKEKIDKIMLRLKEWEEDAEDLQIKSRTLRVILEEELL